MKAFAFAQGVAGFISLGLAWAGLAASARAAELELRRERGAATDLAVGGRLRGVPAGETRYLRWAELRALPVTRLKLSGEFVPGEQEVTVLFLADLWARLPREAAADVVLASCTDGYASVFRAAALPAIRPFIVLEINGEGPDKWPPPGLKFNPGPYVISVAATVAPAVAELIDAGHKKPWGVTRIEIAEYAERFRDAYAGRWTGLTGAAADGRELWIHSCASCHEGPGKIFGGTKSARPFVVVEALAGYSPGVFKTYVREPKRVFAEAKMEAHPHYSETQLDALIAFVTAGRAK